VVHYMPNIAQSPSATMRAAAWGSMMLSAGTQCLAPGAPITNVCGKYIKTEYKDCTFPTDVNLFAGALDKGADYTVRGSAAGTSGIIKGCEDKVVKQTTYCYRRTPDNAFGSENASFPSAVDCAKCDSPEASTATSSTDACPGFFGVVDPDTMVITDASTAGSFFAGMMSDTSLDIDPAPMVVVHYMPNIAQSPSATMRAAAWGSMMLSAGTQCLAPGAPITNVCGKYIKTEYKDCTFPTDVNLFAGALDKGADYTVRGSAAGTSGIIKGCEDKVVKQTTYCYRRTPDNAFGSENASFPSAVDCAKCDMPDEKDLTCGDIKTAYKSTGCCGYPMKSFQMPSSRRLVGSEDDISSRVQAALRHARDIGGTAKAKMLAQKIRAIIEKHESA